MELPIYIYDIIIQKMFSGYDVVLMKIYVRKKNYFYLTFLSSVFLFVNIGEDRVSCGWVN
jgi:hypothetical protein